MKRLIVILMAGFTAIPLLAQLSGDGYYRIQNTSSYERYLTISNDKIDDTNQNAIISGSEGNIYGYKTITDPICDPSSIFYISKDNASTANNAYNIQAQGINPFGFLQNNGAELKIYPDGDNYFIYGSKGSITLFLVDNNGSDGYIKVARKGAYPQNQNWNIRPVDGTTEYLGIAPDPNIKVGDKYYTTFFADFPFELPEGMKAYCVCNYTFKTGDGIAELKEIAGKVPAKTPVIIECSSLDPADNKVTLLTSNDAPATISGNKLKGVYFCYAKMKGNTEQENTSPNYQGIKNVINYDSKKMRVLGLVDGKLALVIASDDQLVITDQGRYLPANKAYFQFTESVEGDILLLDKEDYEKAGGESEVVIEKCATPTISVVNGKVHFGCETEDVEFHYGFTNPIFANSVGNDMEIPSTYNLTVYATRTGYEDSEVATLEIPVGSGSGNQENNGVLGDLNGDNEVNAADMVTLVNIIMGEGAGGDNPPISGDDSEVTSNISAYYAGGAINKINNTIQSGSQLLWGFKNGSSVSVTIIGAVLINGVTGTESDNLLPEPLQVAAGETKGLTTTIGVLGIQEPKIRFTYKYNQKEYSVEADYKDLY